MEPSADPIIRQLREQVSDNDRALIESINARLRLVARLKAHKESRGLDFVDPDREEWMLRDLTRANRGPLTQDGLDADLPGHSRPDQARGLLTAYQPSRTLRPMTPVYRTWAWSWRSERCGSIA